MPKYTNRPFTKEEIRKVINLWDNKTTREISEEIDRVESSVFYIASAIRKSGYELPKKHKVNNLNSLIKEVIAEI